MNHHSNQITLDQHWGPEAQAETKALSPAHRSVHRHIPTPQFHYTKESDIKCQHTDSDPDPVLIM